MSQQTPITGSFIWTLEDAKTRQAVLMGTRQQTSVYIALVIVVAVGAIYWGSGRISIRSVSDLFSFAVPLFIILIIYLFFRYNQGPRLEQAFSQSPDSNKRIDVTLTHEEIIFKAEGIYENKWEWGTIKEVQRNPKGFCFFLAEQAGIWIPIRAFASQAEIDSLTEFIRNLSQEMPSMKYRELA